MLQYVTSHTYTTVNGKFYRQLRGVGTGYHSSGEMTEILVDWTYNIALAMQERRPVTFALYADDARSFNIWELQGDYKVFLNNLNRIWPSMKFTLEVNNASRELTFLDITVRLSANLLEYALYRKPTPIGT